jgi:predicted molibdopterin-dependent oxidoreductase YjgC
MKEHRYDCENAKFECSLPNCKFKGTRNESMKHLIADHSLHLLVLSENYSKIQNNFDKFEVSNSSIKLNTNNNMQELNKKMNNYKSEISEFFSESYFDELI